MPHYSKPYLPLSDQLALIKKRGLQVTDDAAAIECLHRNGYYRLSAYWYPFRKIGGTVRTDNFLSGSRFEDAVALYKFDKKLKLLLLDAIERVEIAARVEIALVLGRLDPFAYLDTRWFRPEFVADAKYQDWIDNYHRKLKASERTEFVAHHYSRYGTGAALPLWIAIELWDFGLLSYAYSGMLERDQKSVARRFQIPDWRLMVSWLRSLNYARNVIAHHGRLWNLNLSVNPRIPRPGQIPDFDPSLPLNAARIYSVCCILCFLTRVINPQSHWIAEAKTVFAHFPVMPHAVLQDMGFPADWQTHLLWQ